MNCMYDKGIAGKKFPEEKTYAQTSPEWYMNVKLSSNEHIQG